MRIGFVCSTNTQVEMFIPVMNAIANIEDLKEADFLWITLDSYYKWNAEKTLQDIGIEYISLKGDIAEKRFVDLSLPVMYWHLFANIRPQIHDVLVWRRPNVLLFGNDRGLIEKLFIKIAKERKIGTILLQDGLLWLNEVRTLNPRRRANKSLRNLLRDCAKEILSRILKALGAFHLAPSYIGQGGCDLIAVMGEASKRVLEARGVEPEHIVVVGQPRYDGALRLLETPDMLRKRLHLPSGRLVVSVFTSAFFSILRDESAQRQQEEFTKHLICYIEQNCSQQVYVLIKPHPREPFERYARIIGGRMCGRVVHGLNSLDVMAVSDVIVTVPSTIIAEAILLGKPLIVLRIAREESVPKSLGLPSDAFFEVSTFPELRDCLNRVLSGAINLQDLVSSYAHEIVFVPPEGAAQRVTSLVLESALATEAGREEAGMGQVG